LVNQTIRFLQDQYMRGFQRVPHPGQHRLLVGVLQDSRTARGGGSNE
jgi:hypothetical protein